MRRVRVQRDAVQLVGQVSMDDCGDLAVSKIEVEIISPGGQFIRLRPDGERDYYLVSEELIAEYERTVKE